MRRQIALVIFVSGLAAPAIAQVRRADPRLTDAQQVLELAVRQKHIAGAVAIVTERGRTVLETAVGSHEVESGPRMRMDTLFRIASMTKPITSAAVMMLVEDGKLRLDDAVSKYIPEFAAMSVVVPGQGIQSRAPAERSITIRDLLTHTSGITYGFLGQDPHARLYEEAGLCEGLFDSPLTLAESTQRLAQQPLVAQPGTVWNYSMSTDVLGRVIEAASGQDFAAFIADRLLRPLSMNDTHFIVPATKLNRMAKVQRPGDNKIAETVGEGLQRAGMSTYTTTYQFPGRSRYRSGGAGLVSTAPDYVRFLKMLLSGGELDGKRFLESDTISAMTQNQIGELSILFQIHGDKFGYGFGVHSAACDESNGASPGTYSWGGFFHTYFWVDPKREVIGVLMTQLHPFDHMTLWADFQKAVYDGLDRIANTASVDVPSPRSVYREYSSHAKGNFDWRVTDPRARDRRAWKFLPNPVRQIRIDDLQDAVRAEVIVDRWGGHLRTTGKAIRFNGNTWLRLPEITTTPTNRAEYYYSQDNPRVEVPLDHLRAGVNTFDGTCSTRDNHGWGQWGLYGVKLRIYYGKANTSNGVKNARIVRPASGATIRDHPKIVIDAPTGTRRVDVMAFYDGDDEDGDGVFRDWHRAFHQPRRDQPAELAGHAGTDAEAPFEIEWDTKWVPDQEPNGIRLIARVQSADGLWTVTDPVDALTLERPGHEVRHYAAQNVPEAFGVRVGRQKQCDFDVSRLAGETEAVLSLRTWHGWDGHHEPLRFNDHTLPIEGNNHHFDFDRLPIPASALRSGRNTLSIKSDTEHHMLEVLWPGPTLLIRSKRKLAAGPAVPDTERAQRETQSARSASGTTQHDADSFVRNTAKPTALSDELREVERYALTHAGDAANGQRLFEQEAVTKCLICHKVDKRGGAVGPELTHIGGKFDRPHLIESLLQPSQQIVEGYRTSSLVLQDGTVRSGVIRERSNESITLYDANAKRHTVRIADIEERSDSDVSLMPTGLANELPPDDFTDLVAYLETLRTGKARMGSGVVGPIDLPEGFTIETVTTGLDGATALDISPDGRIFVCEQTGAVRVIENGRLLDEPFVTLPVDSSWERGVIGVTFDPNFSTEPWVYICWVACEPYPHHRISRFRANGNVAVPGSEHVLLVGDDQTKMGGKVPNGHQGGALHFGKDGCLYVGIGEQTAGKPSQRLDTFLGKILRIHPDGTIPDDNPFLHLTTGKYAAIWAYGCRNPFTFAVRESDGLMLINDVGGKFEEVNVGQAGANYGWPTTEHGPTEKKGIAAPIHWYKQASIAGGDFPPADSSFPPDVYIFADFIHGWIRQISLSNPEQATAFATGLRRPVDMRFAADGSLYVLLRNAWVIDRKFEGGTGSLLRIVPPNDGAKPESAAGNNLRLDRDAKDESAGGLDAYKITTPSVTYFLEKTGAGLSSLIDRDGNDWLSFHPKHGSGAAGEYRGFPNAVHRQAGSYFHPLNAGTQPSTTHVTHESPDRISIEAESNNRKWACRYDFYSDHATFTMTRMPEEYRYWVLYEGTPGGQYNDDDWWLTSTAQTRQPMTTKNDDDLGSPEWIAFGDPRLSRSLVLLHHENDAHPDRFYQMKRQMTVFGFGRSGLQKYLDSVPQSFSIGLTEHDDAATLGRVAEGWLTAETPQATGTPHSSGEAVR